MRWLWFGAMWLLGLLSKLALYSLIVWFVYLAVSGVCWLLFGTTFEVIP